MSNAHPAITPLDFRLTPEKLREKLAARGGPEKKIETLIKVYALVHHRALAALGPHPVIQECRRVLAVGDVLVALGWREARENGWRDLLEEEPLPEPAVPDAGPFGRSLEGVFLERVTGVEVEEETPDTSLADLVEIMRREGLGTPATYAETVKKLIEEGFLAVDADKKRVRVSARGRRLLRELSALDYPVLDAQFARDIEAKLGQIESGLSRPSDLLKSLDAVVDEATRHQLGWLDTLGEPLAGEPAEAAYARRDKEPSPAPPMSAATEEPETTLAADDPVRLARNRFHAALVEAFGLGWWRMSEAERAAFAVEAVLSVVPNLDRRVWDRRIRYDALLRWALGMKVVPERMPERYWLWLKTLGGGVRARIEAAAAELAEVLLLR